MAKEQFVPNTAVPVKGVFIAVLRASDVIYSNTECCCRDCMLVVALPR
jgi:hypothetical protein